jgi:hypothetical protein
MATQYRNRIKVAITNTGTGTAQLGSAVTGFQDFTNVTSGSTIGYAIDDGSNWEVGTGTYTSGSPGTVTRANIEASSNGGSAISLSGSAVLTLTLTAAQIAALAPLASPTFTGTPAAPTASTNTNTTQLATTAYVVGQAGSSSPTMNGNAATGTSLLYARQDHVHPSDTSRAPTANPTFTGTVALGYQVATLGSLASGGPVTLTTSAQTTSGAVLTFASTTGVATGMFVYGANINYDCTVISLTSTTVTLSTNVTGTVSTGAAIRFLNKINIAHYADSNSNYSFTRLAEWRNASGSSWTTASRRLSQGVDVSDQAFIEWNPPSYNTGLALGIGQPGASTYGLSMDSSGNVVHGGYLAIAPSGGNAQMYITRAAGNFGSINFQTAGVGRWSLFTDNTAETGSNAGSLLQINALSDGGAYLSTPFQIIRSTGQINMPLVNIDGGTLDGTVVGSSTPAAGTFSKLTSAGGLFEKDVAMAANNIDLNTGSVFTKTISGATTLTVSNVPSAGTVASFVLELTNAGSNVTWWSNVRWAGGTAPTLSSSGTDVLGFYTTDGGANWRGLLLGKAFS